MSNWVKDANDQGWVNLDHVPYVTVGLAGSNWVASFAGTSFRMEGLFATQTECLEAVRHLVHGYEGE